MKKVLLGSSAIVLAGAFATQASAAEWDMKVGGYFESIVAFTDTDDSTDGADYNGVDVLTDSEIHFSPSITLDNGIKFGVRIELEGATNSDQIDENYAYVDGSFGRLIIGENDNAANAMGYSAPDVTRYNINSGSDTASLPFSAGFGTTSTFVTAGEADSAGLQYYTPRMAGFQLGASYARDANKSTSDSNKDENEEGKMFNIWGVGANYVNTIGDVSIAASAGYTRGSMNGVTSAEGIVVEMEPWGSDNSAWFDSYDCGDSTTNKVVVKAAKCYAPSTDPEAYAFGLNVGFGGFTVGGSYANYNDQGSFDRYVYDLGASYETGPWGFSLTYLHSKQDDSDDKIDKYLAGVSYSVASGVTAGAFGAYVDSNPGSSEESNMDGFVVGTSLMLSF